MRNKYPPAWRTVPFATGSVWLVGQVKTSVERTTGTGRAVNGGVSAWSVVTVLSLIRVMWQEGVSVECFVRSLVRPSITLREKRIRTGRVGYNRSTSRYAIAEKRESGKRYVLRETPTLVSIVGFLRDFTFTISSRSLFIPNSVLWSRTA